MVILVLVFFTISQNNNYKDEFINQTFSNFAKHNYSLNEFLKWSIYGAHYNAAISSF